jgi:cell division inhibitor SepF
MANVMKKAFSFLGLVADDQELESIEEEVVEARKGVHAVAQPERPSFIATPRPSVVTTRPVVSAVSADVPQTLGSPAESGYVLDQIFTIHPRFYNEARVVGERFREGQPVLMNLSDMEESERKRLVDFASGLVFGHDGRIERVTSKVFLLSPPNVRVSNESKTAAAEASFFNQS